MRVIQVHKCSTCQRSNVQLWRPYGEFLRDETIFCIVHLPKEKKDWYVPLIEDDDGSVWGYTSVPEDAIAMWKSLPSE